MNILLTNDDGINAEGLNSLYKIFSSHHNVFIIAPDNERSACSNAFSLNRDLKIIKVAQNRLAISGFPADCVNLAMNSDLCFVPDLVVSGINHGANLSIDQFYSGTVAGARTAYISGISGIAISMDCYHQASDFFDEVSYFLMNFIEKMSLEILEKKCFLSINYPDISKEKVNGVKYTFLGRKIHRNRYNIIEDNEDEFIMKQDGDIQYFDLPGSDINELHNNYISITPLTIESTDFDYLDKMNARLTLNK